MFYVATMAAAATTVAKRTVNSFVSVPWLAARLSSVKVVDATSPPVRVVDASWFMPGAPEKGYEYDPLMPAHLHLCVHIYMCMLVSYINSNLIKSHSNYLKVRIPGARYFDVDGIADRSSGLPHMMPSNQLFSDVVGKQMGISNDDDIGILSHRHVAVDVATIYCYPE
jgi:hypothetical protein